MYKMSIELSEPILIPDQVEIPKELPEELSEDISLPKKKVKKPRKPMSAEHKAKLLHSLEKARVQSALKRGLKSQAKKILKEKDDKETNEIIRKSLLAKNEEDPRDIQIKELKARLDGLTLQDVIKKPKKQVTIKEEPEPEPEPVPEPVHEPKPKPQAKKMNTIQEIASHVQQAPLIFKSLRGSKMKKRY